MEPIKITLKFNEDMTRDTIVGAITYAVHKYYIRMREYEFVEKCECCTARNIVVISCYDSWSFYYLGIALCDVAKPLYT